jgi:hypothetical protein
MNYDANIVKEKVEAYVIGDADKTLADVSAPSMRDMICQLGDD